jgi:undecaprenyl diphosphate synthase
MSVTPTSDFPVLAATPRHVAVIMDGNGRWAKRRGMPRVAGHRKGQERVHEMASACGDKKIPYLTLFAFSSENWGRPAQEVQTLMDLFARALEHEVSKLHANGVRFRVIGDTSRFNPKIVQGIRDAEALTRDNTALTLTIAANYGGHWDVAQACAEVARRVAAGEMRAQDVTPDTLSQFVCLNDAPAPDLFIRTGGEQRISNFLLWQLAYTELYFTPVLWPDFDQAEFDNALSWYAGRERRFGLTSEQLAAVRNA